MSTDTTPTPGVSIEPDMGVSLDLICAFVDRMDKRFPNRAASPAKLNLIAYHLSVAERIYETLPEVPGERSPADADQP